MSALDENKKGIMISIDFPDYDIWDINFECIKHSFQGDTESYTFSLSPSFMLLLLIMERCNLIEGNSLSIITTLDNRFDISINDCYHSMQLLSKEIELIWNKLTDDAISLVDDIDWSNAFYSFVSAKRLYPVLFKDNVKGFLRVRTAVIYKKHIRNSDPTFT